MQSEDIREPRLVISIDFGTYASGFALQWRDDYNTNKRDIYCNQFSAGSFMTYKTVTCLLLGPDKSFKEFGDEAETRFSALGTGDDKNEKHEDWYFFRHFKMALYQRSDLSERTLLEDVNHKPLSVNDVLSHSIQYMKDQALAYIENSGLPYIENTTKWVLTVPAIWDESAKQVMRSCAEKAGIKGSYLSIALEPEVAGLYCKQVPDDQLSFMCDKQTKYVGEIGSTFMVVDIGGGTVDITALQVNTDGTMKQFYKSGGPYGGMNIDAMFYEMLEEAIGKEEWSGFVKDNREAELLVRRAFELEKRQVKDPAKNKTKTFNIVIPFQLMDFLKKNKKDLLQNGCNHFTIDMGRFVFPIEKIRAIFDTMIKSMLQHIEEVIRETLYHCDSIVSMIVVGGFAASEYVITRLRNELQKHEMPVLRPQNTELAVLKGAVLYGHNEKIITARVMRHTYGVGMVMKFNKKRNDPEKRFTDIRGIEWARDVFRKHVTINQEVKTGEWIADKDYYPDDEKQRRVTVYVYSSDNEDPNHTTDEGCSYVGKFDITFPKDKAEIEIAMLFSGTEIVVRALEKKSGNVSYQTLNTK